MESGHDDNTSDPSHQSVHMVEDEAVAHINASETSIGGVGDVETDSQNESQIGSKRKLTSTWWDHYRRFFEDATQKWRAECKYCKTTLLAETNNGTSNIRKHYLYHCKARPRKMDIRQSILKIGKNSQLESHYFNQNESRELLAKAIMMHDYALSIVDHVGFQRFCTSLNPRFTMVSRSSLKRDVLKIYNLYKSKCYVMLEKLQSRIAITTDMWTCNNSKKGYMTVTAHFIDEKWVMKHCLLRFAYVPAPHTAEVISDVLVEALISWNIDRKVSTITVDNCTTNDAVMNELLAKLSTKDLILGGKVLHMRCNAHILNLIVQVGLKKIQTSIENIRDSVVYWTASPKRIEKYEQIARRNNVSTGRKLFLDCKTRWNSTYLMLETAILYKEVFPRLQMVDKDYKTLPTPEDWARVAKICEKLKVFYEATLLFSGTLYPTSNLFFPTVCDIKIKLEEWSQSSDLFIQIMAAQMMEKFIKYWDFCHVILGVAVVLDPRYKMKLVEFYFPLIYGENAYAKIEEVRRNCRDIVADYKSRDIIPSSSQCGSSLGSQTHSSSSCVTGPTLSTMSMFDAFVAADRNEVTDECEFEFYLKEPLLPRSENFDVLAWWMVNGDKYPVLKKMAKDILTIPISTVVSESAFSTGGRIVSPSRNRLGKGTLDALMCGRRWLWNELDDFGSKEDPTAAHLYRDEETKEDEEDGDEITIEDT